MNRQRKQTGSAWLRFVCMLLVIGLVVLSAGPIISAWEQPAHEAINRRAINLFNNGAAKGTKYQNALFEPDFFCNAPIVTTTGKFSLTYDQIWLTMPAMETIISGGFSADEPNVYVSTKHFYDPLALSGVSELTDQSSVHGKVYEAVPATEWALFRPDNPYCLTNAMAHYKACLEIPYTASPAVIPAAGDFRDLAGQPATLEDMRSMHLGKALRGLGEVMHLVADMTQPAHVRNDSHPRYEITEQAITGSVASAVLTYPRADGLQIADLGDNTWDIMVNLAKWTNSHFYSADTITDPKLEIDPENGELPYPSPIFSQFSKGELNGYDTWFAKFAGKSIPMVKREPGLFSDTYLITTEFALRQAEILLPLAAAANARVIDLFLPTLVLRQQVEPVDVNADLLAKAKEAGAETVEQYEATFDLNHLVANDPQWRQMGLEINYSGPGELFRIRDGKTTKVTNVEFVEGTVVACQDPETGEMANGKPNFIMPLGAPADLDLSGPVIDYTIEMGDAIYMLVTAGARSIKSIPYLFAQRQAEIRLTADHTHIMPGEKVEFEVEIEGSPERYELEWSFGDEDPDVPDSFQPIRNRKLKMKHIYEKEEEYTATVRMIDLKRKTVCAEDSLVISSVLGDMSGIWSIVLTVQEENTFFRNFLIILMKGIINIFLKPLAEALELGPIDESVVDSFTMVGTTLEYEATLARNDPESLVFNGPLTFTGSNTGYISGSEDITGVSLVMENGSFVFYAHGLNENGETVTFPYLANGRMVGNDQLEGTFNMAGTMSGTWTATR